MGSVNAKPITCCCCCCEEEECLKIVDFKLPPPTSPMRVRQAAHLLDDEDIAKYTKAIEIMKALPSDDPRNFYQQAKLHSAYCCGAYAEIGFPDLKFNIHNSWLFFPWHRLYIYFFEKICAKLIGDPYFALPFWNYDSPLAMEMPAMYTNNPNSTLFDELRDPLHQPPTVLDMDYMGVDHHKLSQQQIRSNLNIMYRQMISNAKAPELFLGATHWVPPGVKSTAGAGSVELVPHNVVHIWCGDRRQPHKKNMGNFYTAARDPIFFSHHSNVDRLWTIWRRHGGNNFTDPEWLNTGFLLYNENAELVKVKVGDCLDENLLRYTYQEVDIPWLKARPIPRNPKSKVTVSDGGVHRQFPIILSSVVNIMVQRAPNKSGSKKEEEVLVIHGIEIDKNTTVKFDVFINEEDVMVSGPCYSEFAGSFVNVPHMPRKKMKMEKLKTNLRLGISDLLEDLKAKDDDTVLVTLVPRERNDVSIGGVMIDFLSS